MRKIIVIGSPGAGKSTFSRRLSAKLGLEVIHLDRLFWNPGWMKTPKEEWRKLLEELASRPEWIMDGNYDSTLELRMEAADTVIFLDYPRRVCLWGVIRRRLPWNQARPDMPEGCPEKWDRDFCEFLRFVWHFPDNSRPNILRQMERCRRGRTMIVLRSRKEAERLLGRLQI